MNISCCYLYPQHHSVAVAYCVGFFYTAIGLASALVIDISYGFIDPRIRMGSKK